jgi:hypothetical protein
LRHIGRIQAHGAQDLLERVLPVKKVPEVDAGGIEAKTYRITSGIGV